MDSPGLPVALILFAAFVIWRRWHRATGEQRIDLSTLGGGIAGVAGSLAAVGLASISPGSSVGPLPVLGSAAALVAGGAVAAWSLRRTMFRTEPSGTWYRPDSRVGIPVFAVMVVVLAIKAAHIIEAVRSAQHTQAPIDAALGALDPWTTIVVAFLSAYLGWYQIALTWRAWRSDGWRRLLPMANGARDDREGGLKERVKASLKAARDETKGR